MALNTNIRGFDLVLKLAKPARHGLAKPALWLAVAALFMLAAPAHGAEFRDQTGARVSIPDNPQRIVSLAPNLTELVFALGAGEALVGCCQHSNYPEATKGLPRVGSYFRPDLERIVSLRPDLCLAIKDGTPAIIISRLKHLGIPVVVLNPQSIGSLRESLLLLGSVLNCEQKAQKLAQKMDEQLALVDAKVQEQLQLGKKRPTVVVQVQAEPFMAAAHGTYPAELAERGGGNVPLAGMLLYPRLSLEDILALHPDFIIAPEGDEAQILNGQSGLKIEAQVHYIPADLLFRPSLRSLKALEQIADRLWSQPSPEASSNLDTSSDSGRPAGSGIFAEGVVAASSCITSNSGTPSEYENNSGSGAALDAGTSLTSETIPEQHNTPCSEGTFAKEAA